MPNPPTRLIAWRCPESVLAALDAKAARDGTSRTAALETAVRLGLAGRGSVEGELADLRREIRTLRSAVEALGSKRRQ